MSAHNPMESKLSTVAFHESHVGYDHKAQNAPHITILDTQTSRLNLRMTVYLKKVRKPSMNDRSFFIRTIACNPSFIMLRPSLAITSISHAYGVMPKTVAFIWCLSILFTVRFYEEHELIDLFIAVLAGYAAAKKLN